MCQYYTASHINEGRVSIFDTSIATVCLSGDLSEKLAAIEAPALQALRFSSRILSALI